MSRPIIKFQYWDKYDGTTVWLLKHSYDYGGFVHRHHAPAGESATSKCPFVVHPILYWTDDHPRVRRKWWQSVAQCIRHSSNRSKDRDIRAELKSQAEYILTCIKLGEVPYEQ
jgi:hypothetical protein